MREDLQFILHALYHGFSGGVVTASTAVSTLLMSIHRMPLDWEWAIIVAGASVQFFNSISSFLKDPLK